MVFFHSPGCKEKGEGSPSLFSPHRPSQKVVGRSKNDLSLIPGRDWGRIMGFPHVILPLLLVAISISDAAAEVHQLPRSVGRGQEGLHQWRRSVAESPLALELLAENTSFILAADRTYRKDPSAGYKYYTGGWNISSYHYLASVAFTAIPLFVFSIAWFVVFGVVLILMCGCFCCRRQQNNSNSSEAYALSLGLLIFFTFAAIVGGIVLYDGEGKFHNSCSATLDYVVGQANLTVDNLRSFSNYLGAAENVGVDQFSLPADIQGKIDEIKMKLSESANDLASRTSVFSKKSHGVLDAMRWYLIVIAVVMLTSAFLGFLLSILGLQVLVYILMIIGWVLVTVVFLLCGIFLVVHNSVADTCVAMDEWVEHPHAHTALDDILPCVDIATANESMSQSKEVTFQLLNLVNKVIVNISNADFPPTAIPFYFNQSGPFVPMLCNPYGPDMSDRTCLTGEVDIRNAPKVLDRYTCNTSTTFILEICTTVGRITPTIYNQMTAAVNVSYGLYHYGPFLVGLEDCTFVRDTFRSISSDNCPDLQLYGKWVYIGLVMVSAAVMLSLIFWVIFARERQLHNYNRQFLSGSSQPPQSEEVKAL